MSGGADGAVVVYSPARHGESSLFELVEAEEYDDEDDDEDDDEEIEALYGALDELALWAGRAKNSRGRAAAPPRPGTWIFRGDESAAPLPATRIFRGDDSRRRRGRGRG